MTSCWLAHETSIMASTEKYRSKNYQSFHSVSCLFRKKLCGAFNPFIPNWQSYIPRG